MEKYWGVLKVTSCQLQAKLVRGFGYKQSTRLFAQRVAPLLRFP